MAELEKEGAAIWEKALKDEAYREKLFANPGVELKKMGWGYVPADLKIWMKGGKLNFSTKDALILEELGKRMTKSK